MHFVCYGFDLQDKALMWSNVSMTSTSSMLKRKERNFLSNEYFHPKCCGRNTSTWENNLWREISINPFNENNHLSTSKPLRLKMGETIFIRKTLKLLIRKSISSFFRPVLQIGTFQTSSESIKLEILPKDKALQMYSG